MISVKIHNTTEEKAVIQSIVDQKYTPLSNNGKQQGGIVTNGVINDTPEQSMWFTYKRITSNLWIPEEREIPSWLKASKFEEVALSDLTPIFVEKSEFIKTNFYNKSVPVINLHTNLIIRGSKSALALIRQYAEEKLSELRQKHELIMVNLFTHPPADGIHNRFNIKAVILKKNDREFWTSASILKRYNREDNSYFSIIAYQPTDSLDETEKLEKTAEQIQQLFGKNIAEQLGVKTSVILAQWPTESFGMKVPRYGAVFTKSENGQWLRVVN